MLLTCFMWILIILAMLNVTSLIATHLTVEFVAEK